MQFDRSRKGNGQFGRLSRVKIDSELMVKQFSLRQWTNGEVGLILMKKAVMK